jgi:hypothetical protein
MRVLSWPCHRGFRALRRQSQRVPTPPNETTGLGVPCLTLRENTEMIRRFSSTDRPRLGSRLGVSTRMACSDVSIYPLVDTSRCVHKGHHPCSHLFCPNGSDQLSITHKFSSLGEAQLDVGQAGQASPNNRVSGSGIASTREIAPEFRDPDQVSRN